MTRVIKIEKGVPIPSRGKQHHHKKRKYPLADLGIKESFFFPANKANLKKIAKRISVMMAYYAPKRFTLRTLARGVRCWRIR